MNWRAKSCRSRADLRFAQNRQRAQPDYYRPPSETPRDATLRHGLCERSPIGLSLPIPGFPPQAQQVYISGKVRRTGLDYWPSRKTELSQSAPSECRFVPRLPALAKRLAREIRARGNQAKGRPAPAPTHRLTSTSCASFLVVIQLDSPWTERPAIDIADPHRSCIGKRDVTNVLIRDGRWIFLFAIRRVIASRTAMWYSPEQRSALMSSMCPSQDRSQD